jgi:hypothetical protein
MAQDIVDIIDYYTTPVTIITGAHVSNLRRGVGEIWSGLPAEANVQTLGLGENLAANTEFLRLIRESMHDLSGVPQEDLTKVQHISNTSAAALRMLYHSLTMGADAKTITYGEGIKDINILILKYANEFIPDHPLFNKINKYIEDKFKGDIDLFLERYSVKPVFKYGLPNDRMSVLQEGTIEKSLGIFSKKELLERLGVRNTSKVIKDAEKYEKLQAELGKPKIGIEQKNLLK